MAQSHDVISFSVPFDALDEPTESDYVELRSPGIFYKSRNSTLNLVASQDRGLCFYRARQVFDDTNYREETGELRESPKDNQECVILVQKPRVQIEAMITREAGNIRSVEFQRLKTSNGTTVLQRVLEFNRDEAAALQSFFKHLDAIDLEATPGNTQYLDDKTRFEVTRSEASLLEVLRENPEMTTKLISDDPELSRLRQLYERREAVATFEVLVANDSASESDYQKFFEANKWLIGLSIDAHLFTSVDEGKLEQTTTGFSVTGAGKRIDALLKTAGVINSIAFAEIKKPNTKLVAPTSYRSEAWGPSTELGGAVVQVQQTIHKALETIARSKLDIRDSNGALSETLYSYAPRGYVVAGRLNEFLSPNGDVEEYRFRSYESFRRSIAGITILTYDEVLGRAKAAIEFDESA
ncbi:Shedu immune nuclease family protein [Specibacter sp. NPDC078709]|uniref:Shedu immune nuclease family protein n=1 Tax=Specibacter sp. NPDC078709 TaxID=3154364 RepID=UPI0034209821